MSTTGGRVSNDPQPSDLLRYLPTYRVVICSTCEYALQKNAISRHLKDIHHILRARRRPFMHYVSKLRLDSAEDVIRSEIQVFPVPFLPVQDGFQCEVEGCLHRCVSLKRMKSHWFSVHGRKGRPLLDWRPVPLQTFFKGNLLRYFTDLSTSELQLCDEEANSTFRPSMVETLPHAILDEADTFLLNHYISHTSLSIADEKSGSLWQVKVPELAYQHPFLLHGILACSALHIAHKNPGKQREQLIAASSHQDRAMPLFRSAIANVDQHNCHPVLAFSHLLVIYSFALEKEDERLLLVEPNSPDVLPTWLYFLRNGCLMVCSLWEQLENGPVKALAEAWETPVEIEEDSSKTPLVQHLLSVIPSETSEDAWPQEICQLYHDTAIELGRAFSSTRALGQKFTTWDALRIWPMLISVDYMNLLGNTHPGALILLAHYCILLQKVESHWYFENRATRLLSTIVHHLDMRWHCYIKWPLEEIGGSPSTI